MSAPEPPTSSPSPLPYERPGSSASRKLLAILLVLTAINTLMLSMPFVSPLVMQLREIVRARRVAKTAQAPQTQNPPQTIASQVAPAANEPSEAEVLEEQAKWMEFTQPADRIVYEEEQAAAQRLLRIPGYQAVDSSSLNMPVSVTWTPPVYLPLKVLPVFDPPFAGATVFMHRLVSPAGYVRLVHIVLFSHLDWDRQGNGVVIRATQGLDLTVMFPGTKSLNPAERNSGICNLYGNPVLSVDLLHDPIQTIHPGGTLRVYAGQCDPGNASSFTIPYEQDGRHGIIRGFLTDDDVIELIGISSSGGSGRGVRAR